MAREQLPRQADHAVRGAGEGAAVRPLWLGARDTPSALGVEFSKFRLGTVEHPEQYAVGEDLRYAGFGGQDAARGVD